MTATRIVEFEAAHIESALTLWRNTPHIGLNAVDDQPGRISQFLQHNPGCSFVAVVAHADPPRAELVGTCLCGHDMRRAAIYHLAVSESYRRSGVGRMLLQASLRALDALGIRKCHAFVLKDNPYAQQFWQPQGWTFRDDILMFSRQL